MTDRLINVPADDLLDATAEFMAAEPEAEQPPTANHVTSKPDPKAAEAADPFDPASLALGNNYTEASATRELVKVPVRRPSRDQFFRVNPDPAYKLETRIIESDREVYLVAKPLWDELDDEVQARCLFLYVTTAGVVALWPARLSDDANGWNDTALQGAKIAMEKWIRLKSNRDAGCYDIFVANGDLPEPEWPDKTMGEILKMAFEDRYIASMDHDVVRRLQGLAK